jgi:hypothetical protein
MFCVPVLVFGGTEGVGSRFHVLHPCIYFRRFRGCRVSFSRFASLYSFSTVARASSPVFKFCYPGHIFAGMDGVASLFHVLHFRTHFHLFRGCRVPFSCFASPHIVFCGTDGGRSRFRVLRSLTCFRIVQRASGLVFMFCAPELVFIGSEGVWSHFPALRSRTRFRQY